MLLTLAASLLVLQGRPSADTVPDRRPPSEQTINSAYRDATARELVRRAREYRRYTDRSVRAYQALAKQRTSAGLRMLRRERQLFGSELAARIDWRREGPVRVRVLGARTRSVDDDDDEDAADDAEDLAFDPADDRMRVSLLGTSWIRHPLAEGSERDYRFTTGDTLSVRLSGGETVRVYELRVEPRHLDAPLVSGSIWLEDRSYGVVRTLLRLSHSLRERLRAETRRDSAGRREVNVGARVGEESGRRRRRSRTALLPDVRVDVRYITTEYALVQGRWWMPTLAAVDATITAEGWASVPARFERTWEQYRVEGDTTATPGALARAAAAPEPEPAAIDTPAACRGESAECQCTHGGCRVVEVEIPDSAALATSPELPPPLTPDAPLLSGKEAEEIADELGKVASVPWIFTRPSVTRAPVLLRYNRVEALSVGTRWTADFGALSADAAVRVATAGPELDVEVGVRRESPERRLRLAAYRRLAAADPAARPFGPGNSLAALLWGRDNGDYFRALGVELLGAPPRSERPWLEWRLFAEHQKAVTEVTDASLRGLVGDFDFRPNFAADRADQAGAAFTWRPVADLRLLGTHWAVEAYAEGQAGTFRFARPALTLRAGVPLPGPLEGALEGAAGTSFGDVPAQGLWRLGGSASLRGYDASTAVGTAFWRGRAEVATGAGPVRLALFSDAGWAGDRGEWSSGRPLWSAGAGVSFLQGVVRVDLARALR
ncbi:MAG TPA: hypothetical protein VF746_31665, partial [Longimicrobium sp.]